MDLKLNIIIYLVKTFTINLSVYYTFSKILNVKAHQMKSKIIGVIINLVLTLVCAYIEFFVNTFLSMIVLYFIYGIFLGVITKNKIVYSLLVTLISYAISMICFGIGVVTDYFLFATNLITNHYINLAVILTIQLILLYTFLKRKRFKNGFDFLKNKFNNDITDIWVITVSSIIILMYRLIGAFDNRVIDYDEMTRSIFFMFVIFSIIMVILIQKTLTMYYKQKLFQDTLNEYKKELEEKQNEIDKLNNERFSISKITHEFYNRQKALELSVKEGNADENTLSRIQNLTEEYASKVKEMKEVSKLETTGIPEIDSMFKYMQSECSKNNIEFKLKVIGNIYYLVNNIIPKNKLETLIGDHLRDAINAVNSSEANNKEIFAILGSKENIYELCIYDTGVDFEINTLLKLGLEPVTTRKETGGTGIGFLTTFETLNETKASLIIKEESLENRYYTKVVIIRFDGKNEYKICSHRAEEIEKCNSDRNIIIEKI